MTAGTEGKRTGRARRWVGAILAAVLLPLGVAMVLYSFASGDTTMNASPPTTMSPSTILSPLPAMTVDGSSTPDTPNTPVVITTLVEVQLPTSGGQDSLNLVATIAGLLASVAGIVSAVISARAARSN